MKAVTILLIVLGLGLVGFFMMSETGPVDGGNPVEPSASKHKDLLFFISAHTSGFIVPCGCASKQYGGLPRRATKLEMMLKDEKDVHLLKVDAGCMIKGQSAYDLLKLQFISQGTTMMSYDVVNLGGAEAHLSAKELKKVVEKTKLPLISTNIRPTGDSAWLPEMKIIVKDKIKIGFLGISQANAKVGEGLKILRADDVLRAKVQELSGQVDLLVLLAYVNQEEMRRLAQQFPEFDAILGGQTFQPLPATKEGGVVLAASTNKGKFMATARFTFDGSWSQVDHKEDIIRLDESLADESKQFDLLKIYQDTLRANPIRPENSGEVARLLQGLPDDYKYAEPSTCITCHASAAAVYKKMKHAHAFESIKAKGFDADPYCLRCHSTGYGGPNGYTIEKETPQFKNVTCQSCHGPSLAHSKNPQKRTAVRAKVACATCHDKENSPEFNFDIYWERIKHGKEGAVLPK
jgi:hypothetical protein